VLSEAVLPHQLAPDTQSFRVIVETSPDDRTRAAAQGRTRSYEFKSLRRKTLAVDYESYVSGLQDAGVNVIGIIEYGAGGNVSRTDLRDQ
jgi:hypothetical protein